VLNEGTQLPDYPALATKGEGGFAVRVREEGDGKKAGQDSVTD